MRPRCSTNISPYAAGSVSSGLSTQKRNLTSISKLRPDPLAGTRLNNGSLSTLRFVLILKVVKQRMLERSMISSQTRNRISRPPITEAGLQNEAP